MFRLRRKITQSEQIVLDDAPYIVRALSLVLWKYHPEKLTFSDEDYEAWKKEEHVGVVVDVQNGVTTVYRGV